MSSRLPSEKREAIIAHLNANPNATGPEIEREFGVAPNTAYSYIAKVRRLLGLPAGRLPGLRPAPEQLDKQELKDLAVWQAAEIVRLKTLLHSYSEVSDG